MVKPNFIVIGAPKCGTRSLFEYLKVHPEIFMGAKERHYFGRDLDFGERRRRLSEEEYLKLFDARTTETCIGEKSVWYFYSDSAPEEMKIFNPHIKIVMMLRDPVERLYSHYYQLRYNLQEDLPTFAEALAAESERKAGRRIPPQATMIRKLFYRENADYTPHVRRYLEAFGRDNVHIIIFDDFKADTPQTYRTLLDFLNVDRTFQPDFKVHNVNTVVRNRTVKHWRRRSMKSMPAALKPYVPDFAIKFVKQRLVPAIEHINTTEHKRPPLDSTLRQQLRQEAQSDIEALSQLIDRDLSAWCHS